MRSYILTLAIFLLSSCGIDASIHKPKNVAIQPTWHHRDNAQKKINIRGGQSGGTATMSTEIFNLVKSIVGAGVLSLPAGIAAFGDAPSAIIPAVTLITVIGALSAYGFSLIGRVCAVTNASTYREAWDRTVGTSTSWITAFSSTFSCLFANLAYSMILADTFQNLLKTVGVALTRTQTLFGVTAFILTPLCLLKDLSSLAPFSLLGIMGMAYTAIAMAVRYFGGSYDAVVGGQFANDVAPAVFGSKGATSAHFNAPKFYIELENNTIERFNTGTREGLLDLANISVDKRSISLVNNVTLATLAVVTVMALVVSDLSFVLSFAGATLGNALIYVFPALMFRKMVAMLGDEATSAQKTEVNFAMFACLLGIAMGGIGAFMSVKSLSE
eukprot:scaffold2858_cov256-Chaetoceros_neogracile.AAC.8